MPSFSWPWSIIPTSFGRRSRETVGRPMKPAIEKKACWKLVFGNQKPEIGSSSQFLAYTLYPLLVIDM